MKKQIKNFVYHHTDDDGFGAGAVIAWMLHMMGEEVYWSKAIGYAGPLPMPEDDNYTNPEKDDRVFFVDYSFSNKEAMNQMIEMINSNVNVIWIDHHDTSVENLPLILQRLTTESYTFYIDKRHSGMYLAYEYAIWNLHPASYKSLYYGTKLSALITLKMREYAETKIPMIVKYIDEWDRFVWMNPDATPNTEEFHYGFMMEDWKFDIQSENWHHEFHSVYPDQCWALHISSTDLIIANGKLIMKYQKQVDALAVAGMFVVKLPTGIEAVCLNQHSNSTIFRKAYDIFPAVCPYHYDGKVWRYSLFSRNKDPEAEGFSNLALIAKKYGGGGHLSAAGFTIPPKSQIETDPITHLPADWEYVCPLNKHPLWMQGKEV